MVFRRNLMIFRRKLLFAISYNLLTHICSPKMRKLILVHWFNIVFWQKNAENETELLDIKIFLSLYFSKVYLYI
jgi:hypothetical protein